MAYVLGLDAGNTKTIGLVARTDGCLLGSGRAGPGDIYIGGNPAVPLTQVEAAAQSALQQAGLAPGALAGTAFSMAGADWPEDFELIRTEMKARGFGQPMVVVNDALGALRAGSPDGFGVAVVCGTGAATGARAPNGRAWHSSYWQQPQGAVDLGRQTLAAVYRAELGLGPPTALTGRVLAFFGKDTVEDVLHWRTARMDVRGPQPDLGRLARPLLDEAAAGDETACGIVQAHGAALGDYALVAARQVGLAGSFTLVLSGGVLRHPSHTLSQALIERVRASAPGVQPITSRLEPAAGAVLLALEAAGIAITAALLDNLAATLPPASFFETG